MRTTILLTGVVEDGTERAPSVAQNQTQSLAFPQSETVRVLVRITNPAGVPVPAEGTPTLTVKKRPQDFPPIATLTGSWDALAGAGVAAFNVASTTFRGVEFGHYAYDVVIVGGAGERTTAVPTSPFTLLAAVSAIP
jgi:hypothetical protein